MSYYEQLLDERWIKKRAKIIRRDGRKCTVCGSPYNLRVHHTYYYKEFTEPWKYPNGSLLTVCDTCHTRWHLEHENVYKNKPKKFKKAKVKVKRLTKLDKMTMKYWEIETTSRSGKSLGCHYLYARTKEIAIIAMKRKRLPVLHIKEIRQG